MWDKESIGKFFNQKSISRNTTHRQSQNHIQNLFDRFLASSNFTPQVKEARNQSQIFNRKSISRNTTHRQSYHLQAMLIGVKRWKPKTRSEEVNIPKTAMNKRHNLNRLKRILTAFEKNLVPTG